jgi:hypothetical protein
MMEKLMVDSVVQWAKQYKVDGFRFDIMGFHLKSNMLKVRDALDALTLAKDGVDGKSIYLYGEAWNFGVMANNGRGEQRDPGEHGGTGIGSFSDRIRDAVRGGGPFSPRRDQGFATGLFTEPNGTFGGSAADEKAALLRLTDLVKLGLAGNIASFPITDASGATKPGSQVDYFGMPGAYGLRPEDTIQYIGVHDDPDWFDAMNLKLASSVPRAGPRPHGATRHGRRRVVAGSAVLHGGRRDPAVEIRGPEQLRLGRLVQPHRLDAAVQQLGRGPAAANGNQDDWNIIGPALADPNLKPTRRHRGTFRTCGDAADPQDQRLFRLRTAEEIKKAVSFYNTGRPGAGLIVERIRTRPDVASRVAGRGVVNATPQAQTFSDPASEAVAVLHPVLGDVADPVVRTSKFQSRRHVHVPARTTAVFLALLATDDGAGGGVHPLPSGLAVPRDELRLARQLRRGMCIQPAQILEITRAILGRHGLHERMRGVRSHTLPPQDLQPARQLEQVVRRAEDARGLAEQLDPVPQ